MVLTGWSDFISPPLYELGHPCLKNSGHAPAIKRVCDRASQNLSLFTDDSNRQAPVLSHHLDKGFTPPFPPPKLRWLNTTLLWITHIKSSSFLANPKHSWFCCFANCFKIKLTLYKTLFNKENVWEYWFNLLLNVCRVRERLHTTIRRLLYLPSIWANAVVSSKCFLRTGNGL